ncbi:MAG: TonB family protein [Steroidobacteraceae bacterium]
MKHRRSRPTLFLLFSLFFLYMLAVRADGEPPPTAEKPPTFKAGSAPFFPAPAKRLGLTGRVGLHFSIDAKGQAQNVVVVDSAGQVLDDHARMFISKGHFDVPSDWEASGGPDRHFTLGIIYKLTNKPDVPPFPDDRTTMVLTGSGI